MIKLEKDAAAADLALKAAFSTEEITAAQKAFVELAASPLWQKMTEAERALANAKLIGIDATERATTAAKAEREEREKQIRVLQEQERQQAAAIDAATKSLGQFAEGTKAMKDEIDLVGKDWAAREKLNVTMEAQRAKYAAIAAYQEDTEGALRMIALIEQERDARLDAIDALAERIRQFNATEQMRNIFADNFVDQFSQVIDGTKSVSDAFKDMAKNIARAINQIAAQNIASAIFGKSGGGGMAGTASQSDNGAGP
jgi:hypothetical protein